MGKIFDAFNEEEILMCSSRYYFIKGYATGLKLESTLKALPLCFMTHSGQYRKTTVKLMGETRKEPYASHCLDVCSTLIALDLPLERDELDILLATALLHDVLEDQPQKFPEGGTEFMSLYGIDPRVLENVRVLTKHQGATWEELEEYFHRICEDRLCLMVKLADRGHNSSSLYVMKPERIRKYITEAKELVYKTASYGKMRYPEFSNGITILKSKIKSLINTAEALTADVEPE